MMPLNPTRIQGLLETLFQDLNDLAESIRNADPQELNFTYITEQVCRVHDSVSMILCCYRIARTVTGIAHNKTNFA